MTTEDQAQTTEPKSKKDEDLLHFINGAKQESEQAVSRYHERWASNMNLINGVFPDTERRMSRVRNRSKLFFRKIWATCWRLVASFYNALLRDPMTFKIVGRDTGADPHKAGVLQKVVEYRRDEMFAQQSLFIQFVWAFLNITQLGWCGGKLQWLYDPERGVDRPDFRLYPNEQIFPDMTAETEDQMRYLIFESFMTKPEMERYGYENLDKAQPESVPTNNLRSARYRDSMDPLQNPGENEYPKPGTYEEGQEEPQEKFYRVWEAFYRKDDGSLVFTVTNASYCILQEERPNPYGDIYPNVFGSCLLKPHKLIGEGFPEPLEGPQESYNAHINQRKDNVSLALNRQTIVSRFGNVDLKSLVNSRPGGVTLADDVSAVQERDTSDVTSSAYAEAAADDAMMNEMSGVTPGKMGLEDAPKATVAQLNEANASAKIDLYTAIVAETFFKSFFSKLAYMCQMFETDETVLRIANETYANEQATAMGGKPYDPVEDEVYEFSEFQADCTVNVGLGSVGKELELRQTFLAMDKMIMANQLSVAMLQAGAAPPGGVKMFDVVALMEDALPLLGKKELSRYSFPLQPPNPFGAPPGGGQGNNAMAGNVAPQIGLGPGMVQDGGDRGAEANA